MHALTILDPYTLVQLLLPTVHKVLHRLRLYVPPGAASDSTATSMNKFFETGIEL